MVKATLLGAGWTLHHDAINLQDHWIARQSEMVSSMEVEDLFLRRLQESAITPDDSVPLMSKHLMGYVLDGCQARIACGKHPAGGNHFTEVTGIHNGTVQYKRPKVGVKPGA
jgi:hypothetical protein